MNRFHGRAWGSSQNCLCNRKFYFFTRYHKVGTTYATSSAHKGGCMKKVTHNNHYDESKSTDPVTGAFMGVTLALFLVLVFGVLTL